MELCVTLIFLLSSLISVCSKAPSHGWNDNIDWLTLDEAMKESKETNKPIMLLIHKSWCGACKALKPKFAGSTEIERLSKSFLMVNAMDDDEPKDSQYAPDGGYIPRILFIQRGKVMPELINKGGHAQYKYFYYNVDGVVGSMETALATATPTVEDADRVEL